MLRGTINLSGDKSLTHRAHILSLLLQKPFKLTNVSTCNDCEATKLAVANILTRKRILDCSNSGTTIRLLAGLLSGMNYPCTLIGSDQLTRRPMDRVVVPLRYLGANILGSREKNLAPIRILEKNKFTSTATSISRNKISIQVPSAQVKSALLLHAVARNMALRLTEKILTRDHTENMLRSMGYHVISQQGEIIFKPSKEPTKALLGKIPGDISTAAFFVVGALITPGSQVVLKDVLLNPRRLGLVRALKRMGGKIKVIPRRKIFGEVAGDILATYSKLKAGPIRETTADMIDEIPLLALAATQSQGTTIIDNLAELKIKETNRLELTKNLLLELGANVEVKGNRLRIEGKSELIGGHLSSHGDHRLAMMLKIASLITTESITIENLDVFKDSAPEFMEVLNRQTYPQVSGILP